MQVSLGAGGQGACDGFCSYKQGDNTNDIALNLFFELKPLDLWLDKKRGAERSEEGMAAGVHACKFFIALISPKYFGSEWCMKELRQAFAHSWISNE